MENKNIVGSVRRWVESLVVDLNLCPFAKRELVKNRIRFEVTDASTEEQLLIALHGELELLTKDSSIETTLLIHPKVLQDFYDYNQFLNYADDLLNEMGLEGIYQVASFHPDYQFSDTALDAAENYTNRSPYPLLHILREASLERVLEATPDAAEIPIRNIALMNSLGQGKLKALIERCLKPAET